MTPKSTGQLTNRYYKLNNSPLILLSFLLFTVICLSHGLVKADSSESKVIRENLGWLIVERPEHIVSDKEFKIKIEYLGEERCIVNISEKYVKNKWIMGKNIKVSPNGTYEVVMPPVSRSEHKEIYLSFFMHTGGGHKTIISTYKRTSLIEVVERTDIIVKESLAPQGIKDCFNRLCAQKDKEIKLQGDEISYFPKVQRGNFVVFYDSIRDVRVEWKRIPVLSSFGSIFTEPGKDKIYATPAYIPVHVMENKDSSTIYYPYYDSRTGLKQINMARVTDHMVVVSSSFCYEKDVSSSLRLRPSFFTGAMHFIDEIALLDKEGKASSVKFDSSYKKSKKLLTKNFKSLIFNTKEGKIYVSIFFKKEPASYNLESYQWRNCNCSISCGS